MYFLLIIFSVTTAVLSFQLYLVSQDRSQSQNSSYLIDREIDSQQDKYLEVIPDRHVVLDVAPTFVLSSPTPSPQPPTPTPTTVVQHSVLYDYSIESHGK